MIIFRQGCQSFQIKPCTAIFRRNQSPLLHDRSRGMVEDRLHSERSCRLEYLKALPWNTMDKPIPIKNARNRPIKACILPAEHGIIAQPQPFRKSLHAISDECARGSNLNGKLLCSFESPLWISAVIATQRPSLPQRNSQVIDMTGIGRCKRMLHIHLLAKGLTLTVYHGKTLILKRFLRPKTPCSSSRASSSTSPWSDWPRWPSPAFAASCNSLWTRQLWHF